MINISLDNDRQLHNDRHCTSFPLRIFSVKLWIWSHLLKKSLMKTFFAQCYPIQVSIPFLYPLEYFRKPLVF